MQQKTRIFLGISILTLSLWQPLRSIARIPLVDNQNNTTPVLPTGEASTSERINFLEKHNRKIERYQGGIFASGFLQNENFKAHGKVWADVNNDLLKLQFEDMIFQAPLTVFLMKGDAITLYYPATQKKTQTNRKNFQPAYGAGLPLPSSLLIPMLRGHFYIPENLVHSGYDAAEKKLIMANDEFIVNYLLNDQYYPASAVFKNQKTNERIVFEYSDYKDVQGVVIPHMITIRPPKSNSYLTIHITWIKINGTIGNVWTI